MNEYLPYILAGLALSIVVVWFILARYLKGKKIQTSRKVNIDVEKIITALGGKGNIVSAKATNSRLSVVLEDDQKLKIEDLKQLGASGIVQTTNKVTVILGQVSQLVAEEIDNDR